MRVIVNLKSLFELFYNSTIYNVTQMRDWDDPYNEFDFSVIALSYTAAVIFGYTAKALRGSSWKTNLSLLSLVLFMLIVLIWKASIPFYELPWILFIRIFDGTTTR